MFVHCVYFTLSDNSDAAKQELIDDCHEFLASIPGIVFFAAGSLAGLSRPVNDREFDVALTIAFEDQAAHDAYADHPQHLAFVEKNQSDWKQVRVFDSDVARQPRR